MYKEVIEFEARIRITRIYGDDNDSPKSYDLEQLGQLRLPAIPLPIIDIEQEGNNA